MKCCLFVPETSWDILFKFLTFQQNCGEANLIFFFLNEHFWLAESIWGTLFSLQEIESEAQIY